MAAVNSSKYLVTAGWDDVAHLDADTKAKMLQNTPPHLRKARSQGAPSLGAGAIYPFEEEELKVDPFAIPRHWRRVYALDVGWNRTAVLWGAIDPDTDILYLTSEHYRGQAEASVHAAAIKARGEWIPGVIDPASKGRSQVDGQRLFNLYVALGLNLKPADNSVEAGIVDVYDRMSTGRLKVFSTLMNWWAEFRLYRRDENGKIVKKFDHLMDCTRYLVVSGRRVAIPAPAPRQFNAAPVVADSTGGY